MIKPNNPVGYWLCAPARRRNIQGAHTNTKIAGMRIFDELANLVVRRIVPKNPDPAHFIRFETERFGGGGIIKMVLRTCGWIAAVVLVHWFARRGVHCMPSCWIAIDPVHAFTDSDGVTNSLVLAHMRVPALILAGKMQRLGKLRVLKGIYMRKKCLLIGRIG